MSAVLGADGRRRCGWAGERPDYQAYHDDEWGRALHGDDQLFERVTLEAFQSGLSWLTILRKRPLFRCAFDRFQLERVARYGEAEIARLLADRGIVRNRAKIEATIQNARAALTLPDGLSALLWSYAPAPRPRPRPRRLAEIPATSPESVAMAKDLKRRGFRFVGPTTAYALMQATGMIDDHLADCHVPPGSALRADEPVAVVESDPQWPARFEALREALAAALGPIARRIDHVGATSVPGLPAEDVIDIQVAVADESDYPAYRSQLESTGVSLRYREPGWSMFRPVLGPRTHYVHVVTDGSPQQQERLLFAAYLRAHPARREAYATLKAELAAHFPADRGAYTAGKSEFIAETLRLGSRGSLDSLGSLGS